MRAPRRRLTGMEVLLVPARRPRPPSIRRSKIRLAAGLVLGLAAAPLPACAPGDPGPPAGETMPPDSPPAGSAVPGEETLAVEEVDATLGEARVEVTIDVPDLRDAAAGEGRLGLQLEEVEAAGPGGAYDVYAGLPAGAEPDPAGPYYLGSLAPFGPAGQATAVGYDLGPVRERLEREGRWGEELTLTFVRRGLLPPGDEPGLESVAEEPPPVEVGRVRIVRQEP